MAAEPFSTHILVQEMMGFESNIECAGVSQRVTWHERCRLGDAFGIFSNNHNEKTQRCGFCGLIQDKPARVSITVRLITKTNRETRKSTTRITHQNHQERSDQWIFIFSWNGFFTGRKRSCGTVCFQIYLWFFSHGGSLSVQQRVSVQGGSLSGRPPCMVNEWAVRILLECILVW